MLFEDGKPYVGGLLLAVLLTACSQPTAAPEGGYTRGSGVYPGEPAAYTGPEMVPAGDELRNLALHRVARHSSSYDYNLTAQLVTDGIHSTGTPYWIDMELNGESLPKRDRERLFDEKLPAGAELPADGRTHAAPA